VHDHAEAARKQLRQQTKTLAVWTVTLVVLGGLWLALTRTTPAAEPPPQSLLRVGDVVLLIAVAGALVNAVLVVRTWIRYRRGVPAHEAHAAGRQRLWDAWVQAARHRGD